MAMNTHEDTALFLVLLQQNKKTNSKECSRSVKNMNINVLVFFCIYLIYINDGLTTEKPDRDSVQRKQIMGSNNEIKHGNCFPKNI